MEDVKVVLLIKGQYAQQGQIDKEYFNFLVGKGAKPENLHICNLPASNKKMSAKEMDEFLAEKIPLFEQHGMQYILCTDADMFRRLTKVTGKVTLSYGYEFPCHQCPTIKVIPIPNHATQFFDSNALKNIQRGLDVLVHSQQGTHVSPGELLESKVFKTYEPSELYQWLEDRKDDEWLTCDIEGYSLDFYATGIGTIAFADANDSAISIAVDYGNALNSWSIKAMLKEFFNKWKKPLVFHNAGFDVKVLIYELYMSGLGDVKGQYEGIDALAPYFECTSMMSFLSKNTCGEISLGLKELAQPYAGNYGIDVTDITAHPVDTILGYNGVDALSTAWLYKQARQWIVEEDQLHVYEGIKKDSQRLLFDIELTGMTVDVEKVKEAKAQLTEMCDGYRKTIAESCFTKDAELILKDRELVKVNSKLKKLVKTLDDIPDVVFNPNSGQQVATLLYEVIGLPVLATTYSGQPTTKAKYLGYLKEHTSSEEVKELLEALANLTAANKLLTSFIPSLEKAQQTILGDWRIYGNFKVDGTKSGRLSSNNPNLQNIPSNAALAWVIKQCFTGTNDFLFVGADFNSLEDMISALTTKDENKIKTYTDGYDGHSLRAHAYYPEELGHIPMCPTEINKIGKTFADLRQESKAPTFALTYQGTYRTLMINCGFSEEKAKRIEANFKKLYCQSIEWVDGKLRHAASVGYVTLAFGLKLRTPRLHKSVYSESSMTAHARKEKRTAGNALGQSYGMLNSRAAAAFMKRVREKGWEHLIRPVALIHDAIYLMIRNQVHVVEWVNRVLVEEMSWQELPEIAHDQVKLGAGLEIFYPDWTKKASIPNGASEAEIEAIAKEHIESLLTA